MAQVTTVVAAMGEYRGMIMGGRPHDGYDSVGAGSVHTLGLGDDLHALTQGRITALGQNAIDQYGAGPAPSGAAEGLDTALAVVMRIGNFPMGFKGIHHRDGSVDLADTAVKDKGYFSARPGERFHSSGTLGAGNHACTACIAVSILGRTLDILLAEITLDAVIIANRYKMFSI